MTKIRFDGFELEPETGELWRNSDPVPLAPQTAILLGLLARDRGRIVTREAIRDALWDDEVIDHEQAINAAIRKLRIALEDDAADPRFVETVPRRGYRFIADAVEVGESRATPGPVGQGAASAVGATAENRATPEGSGVARASVGRRAILPLLVAVLLGTIGIGVWAVLQDDAGGATVVAVVPARLATTSPEREAFADTLTRVVTERLSRLPDGPDVVPFTWEMSYDPERAAILRDGSVTEIDLLVEMSVRGSPGAREVAVTVTRVGDGRQLWYRRFTASEGAPEPTAEAVAEAVAATVRENLAPGGDGPGSAGRPAAQAGSVTRPHAFVGRLNPP